MYSVIKKIVLVNVWLLMDLFGVVCGDGGCGLVVLFKEGLSVQVQSISPGRQFHPDKRSQPLLPTWLSLQQQSQESHHIAVERTPADWCALRWKGLYYVTYW